MELQFQDYSRKPFVITAVQLTLDNVEQVAEWCGGTIEKVATKVLGGAKIVLPVVKIKGTGDLSHKTFVGSLGCYIAEMRGSYRVYSEQQMKALFDVVVPKTEEQTTTEEPPHDPEIENISSEQLEAHL